MTNQQIRMAIAEFMGIESFHTHYWDERDDRRYFICTRCGEDVGWGEYSRNEGVTLEPCSGTEHNFPEDLNACHEAEKKLFGLLIRGFDASGIYWNALTNVAGKRIWHATARQRCEALLRVLGKWKE